MFQKWSMFYIKYSCLYLVANERFCDILVDSISTYSYYEINGGFFLCSINKLHVGSRRRGGHCNQMAI